MNLKVETVLILSITPCEVDLFGFFSSAQQDERARKEDEEAKKRAVEDAKKKKTLTSLHFGGYMQRVSIKYYITVPQ